MELVNDSTAVPKGIGQRNSCGTLLYCLWALGNGTLATHCLTIWASVRRKSCKTPPHCVGQRTVELKQHIAAFAESSGH